MDVRQRWAIRALVCAAFSSACWAGPDDVARFLREYPDAGQRLQSHFSEAKGVAHTIRKTPGRPARELDINYALSHGYRKIWTVVTKPEQTREYVVCAGPKTGFMISRPQGTKGTYDVESAGKDNTEAMFYEEQFGNFIGAPYNVLGIPLTKVMSEPTFKMLEARTSESGGERLMEIEYEVGTPARKFSVTLAPASAWTIRHARGHKVSADYPEVTYDVEYAPGVDGIPNPKLVSIKNPAVRVSCELNSISFEPTPEKEFKLAYYEMPDLNAPPIPSSRRSLIPWIVTAAALALLAAIGLRVIANRRQHQNV